MSEIDDYIKDNFKKFKQNCENAAQSCQKTMREMHVGRANTTILDKIIVNAYGSKYKLNEVATVSILDNNNLSVKVWDRSVVSSVEKAILASELNLNPILEGEALRIPIAPMTKEKRLEIVKVIKKRSEDFKLSVQNARKIIKDKLKKEQKTIPKDDMNKYLKEIEETTKKYIDEIITITEQKEKSVLN